MLQGDLLSVILFILAFNPLSFLLNKCDGYQMGAPGNRDKTITHLSFVDDMKLYAGSRETLVKQLDVVSTFSKDVGMSFGEDKCAYVYVEKGKRKTLGSSIVINGLTIQELAVEKTYKYLGVDETVKFDSELNKHNVQTEYKRRLRKIWTSELNGHNKVIATNVFAVPIVTYGYGILDWTKQEIRNLDITTRKVMNMANSLNRRSDVDRIYVSRKQGGRGLRNLEDEYVKRIVGLNQHLVRERMNNPLLDAIMRNNMQTITMVATNILREMDITADPDSTPRQITSCVGAKLQATRIYGWKRKSTHGYFPSRMPEDTDAEMSWSWLQSGTLTSQVESYVITMQDQEIYTRETRKRHEKDPVKKRQLDGRCRVCKTNEETLQHILCCCSSLSPSLYLENRHNPVAKVVYDDLVRKYELRDSKIPLAVNTSDKCDVWWDQKINMPTGIKHNKPDIVVWDKDNKRCQVIDISVPLDTNIEKSYDDKVTAYLPLVGELARLYREYKYEVVPVIIGALGTVNTKLLTSIDKLELADTKRTVRQIQKRAIIGSLKVVKTVMKMRE